MSPSFNLPPSTQSPVIQAAPPAKQRPCRFLFPGIRSLRGKLLFTICIVAGLGIIATATATYALWRMEDKIRIIESFYELNQKVLEIRRYEKNYFLFNDRKDLLSALDYVDQVRASIVAVKAVLLENKNDLETLYDKELGQYEAISRHILSDRISPQNKQALENSLRKHGQDITKAIFDMDARARVRVEREVAGYQKSAVLILALAVGLGTVLVFYMMRWIMRPLTAIREASARIMQGEMNSIPMDDEVLCSVEGIELVNSLNLMLQALNTKQNQLVQSEKLAAIGKVTAGIAHEINNPLNNISLTAEVLLEDLPNLACSERMDMVRDILVQSDRAREVVHHLLEFSRTRKSNVLEPVDLVALVESSIALVKNQFRLGGIIYHYDHPEQPVLVSGNSNHLQQVLVNLMLNAVQAMQPNGRLDLIVGAEQKVALIVVRDTGAGIAPEALSHIFDPFFTTKNEGTGLGLSLSYAIVKDHGGDIVVESEPGKGTTFRLTFPQLSSEA
ncbi:ATP-binding protein [Thiovibrio frasassiensis]|uniref:histidine kinase n=1 Tax=Thiovibrio frasassiensis TaxID=2984131 RepID=A0A9X4MHX9_9BACT|nr:HAMP domain-containing sensor histidine kinase [Thiovibrio frasassiensis]MDG4476666.1 HAMP domain-containing histidine kinase [Thiovibrio frasassiensis]